MVSTGHSGSDGDEELLLAQRGLKRMKKHSVCDRSNTSELLFSTIGHVLNDLRRNLTPANLESQISLHLHDDL